MNMGRKIKIAFGSVPKDGGTFTFYRNMRPALLAYNIDMRCVTIGRRETGLVEDSYIDDGCVLLAPKTRSVKKQAMIFSEWCEQEQVDIVMAINSEAILSSLPHLSKNIRVVSRCANAFDEGYQVTLSGRERIARIIALTPRLRDDLITKYNANPNIIELIPNGIDSKPFKDLHHKNVESENGNSILNLGFLGRLEHNQKGVLYLPGIVEELNRYNISFKLRIAGKGKHEAILKEKLSEYIQSGKVEFVGAISRTMIPAFLNDVDVFLFTSHFEGCPNALLEAMMAGCVPISFLIKGITDYIIKHGETGYIVSMGDCKKFADYVMALSRDREMLKKISDAVLKDAHDRFVVEIAARKYIKVFRDVMATSLPDYEPLPWSEFKVDPAYKRDWSFKHIVGAVARKGRRVLGIKF